MTSPDRKPLVTIVIAAYNAEATIGRALESVLGQSWSNLEVIVVNDGSTDLTLERMRPYQPRVSIVTQANQGVSSARNAGIRLARGEFLGFLDADDELKPGMVEALCACLARFPQAGGASGAYMLLHQGVARRIPGEGSAGAPILMQDFFRVYARVNLVCTGALLLRRSALAAVGGFREDLRFGEDMELWTRVAGRFPWAFIDQVVMNYHLNPGTSTTLQVARPPSVEFLYPEQVMRALVRPDQWGDYRYFRRQRTLERCRAMLASGLVDLARLALARARPVEWSAEWLATWWLARLSPRTAQGVTALLVALKGGLRSAARRWRGHAAEGPGP